MTYQGARARPEASEVRHVFAVSKVDLDAAGHVTAVMWAELDGKTNQPVGVAVRESVAEVVEAIHAGAQVEAYFPGDSAARRTGHPERPFAVIEHPDGHETIALAGPPEPGRNLADIAAPAGPAGEGGAP